MWCILIYFDLEMQNWLSLDNFHSNLNDCIDFVKQWNNTHDYVAI